MKKRRAGSRLTFTIATNCSMCCIKSSTSVIEWFFKIISSQHLSMHQSTEGTALFRLYLLTLGASKSTAGTTFGLNGPHDPYQQALGQRCQKTKGNIVLFIQYSV